MERNDKQTNPFLFQLVFTQIKNTQYYPYLNGIFIIIQFSLILFKFYYLIDSNILTILSLPFNTIFMSLVVLLGIFIGLTVFSYQFEILNTLWVYLLIFLESIQIIFIETTLECFSGTKWCEGDVKYELCSLLIFIFFLFVVYIRSHSYSPFYDCTNPLAMKNTQIILFFIIYNIFVSLSTSNIIMPTLNSSKQLSFLLTCALYAVISNPPYTSPFLARIFYICTLGVLWTSGLIWITPVLENLLNLDIDYMNTFWYSWGYSFPIIIGLGFAQTIYLAKGYQWKDLFKNHNIEDTRNLYLQTTELIKVMQIIKKSQLKSNSVEFKSMWQLIKSHNQSCSIMECPLKSLQGLRIERGDELMQQKRFNKTIEKILEYNLNLLIKLKDQYPNSIQLNIQIAKYDLEIFHQRTKGLQLYNRQYNKSDLSKQQMWGIFYLKRKIQGFESQGQIGVKGESEQQITSFKHDIEVSVSMLAQFWYFLSDPKCNLKKLYDLANVLFPMKIRVDHTWKMIKQYKNIECYHLYAKYLIKMFNDKQKGMKILQQAHKLEIENSQKQQISSNNQSNINQQHGVIFLQFDGKNSGIMYQVNTACELIFGYNKGQLQGRKVNDIMPKVYSIHHDKILENYQQTNRPKMMNKQRVIWGKSKDGYLFPFTICIKPVRNYYSQTSEVYASVKRDLWVRESAFFFTDSDLNLSDISASLLGFFPNLHGRIHLKKKVSINEIVPDFHKLKQKIITQKQSFDFSVDRTFSIGQGQQYIQKIPLSLIGEEVTINVSGKIGYYFKVIKNTGSVSNFEPASVSASLKQGNADASNSYWMKRENDFRFVASVQGEQIDQIGQNNQRSMIYHGGLVKENNQTRSIIHSRIQSSFEQTKLQQNHINETYQKVEYGRDIKIKRLMGTGIREIHQLSQPQQQNNMIGDRDHQQQQNLQMVKPSQLNSILSRQNGNKHINFLKLLTIIILLLSTLLSIFQYILTYSNNKNSISLFYTLSSQNSLEAQIMYINRFSNLYALAMINDSNVIKLKSQINELNDLLTSISYSITTQITYNDNTNQSMILSFAIDKLISQAQLLAASYNVSLNDPHLFFVQYNSVNGLEKGCEQTIAESISQLLLVNDSLLSNYAIYLAISASIFFIILVIKNLILRAVLKKKAQILNVFFQIPRYACSSIQKQCERFIQRLTMDEEDDQFQFQMQSEQDEHSSKRYGKQKKRTIMGEQKTASSFIIASFLLLIFLLVYPILVIISARSTYESEQYSFASIGELMTFEKQMAKTISYIDTYYSRNNFPLNMMSNATQVISNEYKYLGQLLGRIEQQLFYLGNILSKNYLNTYNNLFFGNLCDLSNNCSSQYGEDKGLNAVLFYYYDYVVQKYQLFQTNSTYYTTILAQKQQRLRLILKKYWRKFENILLLAVQQQVNTNDSALFALMLAICIANMTALMWGWIRFYNSLGQKIIATEYILTFIPIDEINKNPKIAKYIKEQVLRAE